MPTNRRSLVPNNSAFHRSARVAALALIVWCALAQGAPALAVSSRTPVVVDDCRITNTRSYVSAFRPLMLAFTNRRATPAEEVRFTVQYGGHTEHIVDRGTFSQNVRIDHSFNGFFNVRYRGTAPSCRVDYVEFEDASVWMSGSPSAAPEPTNS
jgi:hypothetical protein